MPEVQEDSILHSGERRESHSGTQIEGEQLCFLIIINYLVAYQHENYYIALRLLNIIINFDHY